MYSAGVEIDHGPAVSLQHIFACSSYPLTKELLIFMGVINKKKF